MYRNNIKALFFVSGTSFSGKLNYWQFNYRRIFIETRKLWENEKLFTRNLVQTFFSLKTHIEKICWGKLKPAKKLHFYFCSALYFRDSILGYVASHEQRIFLDCSSVFQFYFKLCWRIYLKDFWFCLLFGSETAVFFHSPINQVDRRVVHFQLHYKFKSKSQ